jgi:hypothetical protein
MKRGGATKEYLLGSVGIPLVLVLAAMIAYTPDVNLLANFLLSVFSHFLAIGAGIAVGEHRRHR